MKNALLSLTFLCMVHISFAQSPAKPAKQQSQFGLRFGYSLQLPSSNSIDGVDLAFFEAGHEISYGAYFNIPVENKVQFSPYFGLEHIFWPKSLGYSQSCDLDSFPTFFAIDDSIPGRDFRFYNLAIEPAFKFQLNNSGLFLKVQPHFSFNLRTRVENYTHDCEAPRAQGWLVYEDAELRKMSFFNLKLGFGIVKEVRLNDRTGLSLEPGFKANLSPLLTVRRDLTQGSSFSQYPLGFYVNIGLFR